jgi:hypothetical protein
MSDPAAKKPAPGKATSPAAEFPALRSFLRGYLHQDMKDEYGSPEEAAREFCADASGDERAAVAEEWSRFLASIRGQPLAVLNQILTGPLGSSNMLTDSDVAKLSAVFSPAQKRDRPGLTGPAHEE